MIMMIGTTSASGIDVRAAASPRGSVLLSAADIAVIAGGIVFPTHSPPLGWSAERNPLPRTTATRPERRNGNEAALIARSERSIRGPVVALWHIGGFSRLNVAEIGADDFRIL